MSEPHFMIMPIANGFMAISNKNGWYTARSLEGFGAFLRDQVRDSDAEFSLSEDLRQGFTPCMTCKGTSEVETDGVAGQYLRDEFDAIDWSKKAAATCPTCAGLGVVMPAFWRSKPDLSR